MKKRVVAVVFCFLVALALAGCDFFTGLFLPKVVVADAREAWVAVTAAGTAAALTGVRLDDGSNPYYLKVGNAAGTLFLESTSTNGGYPITVVLTAKSYTDPTSGYAISGTRTQTMTATPSLTWDYSMDLDHATKPVKKMVGTISESVTLVYSGSVKFNNDEYTYADLGTPPQ
jgi:hypothetical protein